jgi:hypothetical protein
MNVEHVIGDLLDYPFGINVIVHVANNAGVMGSGIALSIKQRYPAAYKAYMEAGHEMGEWSQAEAGPGRLILNLVAQDGYGRGMRHLDYEAFYAGLADIHGTLKRFRWTPDPVVGMPYLIGCHRAGGSWKVVKAMIDDIFEASPIRCVIVQLPD